jgi:hypothetical protein
MRSTRLHYTSLNIHFYIITRVCTKLRLSLNRVRSEIGITYPTVWAASLGQPSDWNYKEIKP